MRQVNEVDLAELRGLEETCRGPIECLVGDAVGWTVAVFFTGVALAVLLVALVHLKDATAAVAEERERTVAEREGFAAFGRRVAAMDVKDAGPVPRQDGGRPRESGPPPTLQGRTRGKPGPDRGSASALGSGSGSGSSGGLSTVEDAYRATVMDVDHYEEEYDEPFEVHFAAEFGTELAGVLDRERTLTPQLQSVLVSKARASRNLRSEMVDSLDDEAEALSTAAEDLGAIERRLHSMAARPIPDHAYDELVETWEDLDEMETAVADHLADRQSGIHAQQFNRGRPDRDGPETLQSYLYSSLPVDYPVLADGTDLLSQIRTARGRVAAAVAAGPGALRRS